MTQADKQRNIYAGQHLLYAKRIRPIFLNALQRQIEPVIQWLEANLGDPPLDALLDSKIFRLPMVSAYGMVGQLSAKRSYYLMRESEGGIKASVIDLFIDLWAKIFRDYALNYAYRIENELTETTKEEIRRSLAEGRELGYNNFRLATLMRKNVQGQISRSRAILIALTESTTASNLGAEEGAKSWLKEQGQKGYQQWLGRDDGKERHTHVALNDKIIPIGDKWNVGGEFAYMPGDTKLSAKERCKCRCTRLFMSERRYLRMQANQ